MCDNMAEILCSLFYYIFFCIQMLIENVFQCPEVVYTQGDYVDYFQHHLLIKYIFTIVHCTIYRLYRSQST